VPNLGLLSQSAQFGQILGLSIGVRTRGLGGLQPPDSGKIIFPAKAKFFGQKPAAKNEKKTFFGIY